MKVTIEGDLAQVSEAMNVMPTPVIHNATAKRTQRQRRVAENRSKREEFSARRKVVVDAFKLARRSGTDQDKAALLEAIRRTGGVTDGDLELAHQVLASLTNGEQ